MKDRRWLIYLKIFKLSWNTTSLTLEYLEMIGGTKLRFCDLPVKPFNNDSPRSITNSDAL